MSNGEEFEFFKRIEKLEKATKKLKFTETTAQDNSIIAMLAIYMAFYAFYFHTPNTARKYKDLAVSLTKEWGLSSGALSKLEQLLLLACDTLEKRANR